MNSSRLTLYHKLLTPSREYLKSLVGVVQVSAGLDTELNFQKNKQLIEQCAQRGAKIVCLPENFHFMGRAYTDGISIAQPLTGEVIKRYKQLALDN